MKLRALTSFSGALTMVKDEVATCSSEEVAMDLIRAGYAEEVKSEEAPAKRTTKKVKKDEDQ